MNKQPIDRLLEQAALAPAREIPELDLGLENRVLAAMRTVRRSGEPQRLLRVLRLGLALAGGTAALAVVLAMEIRTPGNQGSIEETFVAPEPEAYLALQ